ncbi:CAP domain-containing protein [Terriglobus sp.]|uniref:CAP domain-containing protein n=1 Tax=Terriglobus sp. TaxID=1889013 RepID=UPI003B00BF94
MRPCLVRAVRWTACIAAAALCVPSATPQLQSPRVERMATIAEQYLLRSINAERFSRSLPAVHFTAELQEAAYRHAINMARANSLEHQLRGEPDLLHRGISAGAHFTRITENIGVGPSILAMHVALMHSPHHRENILDDQVSAIGIAVVQVRGEFWAVEDFSDTAG